MDEALLLSSVVPQYPGFPTRHRRRLLGLTCLLIIPCLPAGPTLGPKTPAPFSYSLGTSLSPTASNPTHKPMTPEGDSGTNISPELQLPLQMPADIPRSRTLNFLPQSCSPSVLVS